MTQNLWPVIAVAAIGYLIGSIPTAYFVSKLNRFNIFDVGSGNMGATNITRVLGVKWGLLVWFLDSMKGVGAVILTRDLLPDSRALATTLAAVMSIVGHNWSLYILTLTGKLRGGKGAATAFGTLFMVLPAHIIGIFLLVSSYFIARTRYMSLGVLILFTLCSLYTTLLVFQNHIDGIFAFYGIGLLVLIVYRFRENIQRLIDGTERRLFEGRTQA
jgi:glycerol-3-phosphate acyltransferase PlsY